MDGILFSRDIYEIYNNDFYYKMNFYCFKVDFDILSHTKDTFLIK